MIVRQALLGLLTLGLPMACTIEPAPMTSTIAGTGTGTGTGTGSASIDDSEGAADTTGEQVFATGELEGRVVYALGTFGAGRFIAAAMLGG
ncbi:MAG: hypothetical protein AB1Z98_30845 [Nannocystaceae bacterium]